MLKDSLRDAVPLDQLRRALVVKLRHHGDVLLTAPVFTTLKTAVPAIEVDALVYADTRDMLAEHPAIAQLHTIDRQWKKLGPLGQFGAEWALLQTLRRRRYDLVINLTEHWRGAWLARLLGARWSVAPRRPERGAFWVRSFSHLYPRPPTGGRHAVDLNLDALRRIGIHPGPTERAVVLVPGAAAEARVGQLLAAAGIAEGRFVHLHPGSRWTFKCWSNAHFAELCRALGNDGRQLVLSGAPDPVEREMLRQIAASAGVPLLDLGGQLSLRELAALTRRAAVFVGVDSAPMHIAAAMQTPVVALFGPSSEIEWGPWQVAQRVIASAEHRCRPCGLDGCGGSKRSDCLSSIPLQRVREAVAEVIRQ